MGMMYSSKKFKEYVFDVSAPEENTRWKSAQSRKNKSHYSSEDNHKFLESFAVGNVSRGKKPRDGKSIVHEVDEMVNERICRPGAALESSSSNYNSKTLSQSKCTDYFPSHKAATDGKYSDRNQPLHLADTELVSIISDEDIDNSSTMSSDALADAEGLSGERDLEHESTSHDKESSVVVCPECVTYGRSCYSTAQLTFFRTSIKLDVSEEGATGCLTFEWKTLNLVSIESRWLDPFKTTEVCLRIKSEHGQKSGVLEVKFTVTDSCWSNKQDLIKSLDTQYKEKWDVDLDSYELFEDTTYLEGDGDSIAISKRDFQLLQPEKFINDTIVDFYIEYLKQIKPADARVHFFNSFFFRKLADFDENQSRSIDFKEAFQRVRKWTKKVDIFQKDYIFIPVNFRLHWSLIIICHPGEVAHFTDDEMESSLKVPCILHMDSIKGHHRGLEPCIKYYLWEEWKERNTDASEHISTKIQDLRFIRLEVPQQENSYDCGLFMLHYMELFVKQASNNFNPLKDFISPDWFYPMEASLKRARIKRLIFELTKSNIQKGSSPKSSYELKDEDDDIDYDDDEADVQILHDACNSKETCGESVSGPCVNNATPLMVKPLRSVDMDVYLSDSDIDGGSLIADSEQKNHGQQMVLYDPSIRAMSPTKKIDETEDSVDKQIVTVSETNKINPTVNRIKKSMNLLQLKDKSGGDNDVLESHDVEDSDDDVYETCVVEDSGSDNDSDVFFICDINNNHQKTSSSVYKNVAECGLNAETSKTRRMLPMCFGARKRRRRSR
ncbi:putative Ulp1 peptidase [Helianthus annuus]|uniref:Putative ulp1 protease family, C-terminal catalytic domain-containing protein n=1 Tax=Helianthus annuus TaxID=4232 RepID=A0A251TJ77_HELAN|nr:probable ubiquitin-like-specific protease 2B isoform X3 [Helianthus annuus]KAF5786732.1 putative Ulp1 peptidase [Helianthus annuus]